jgi:glutaredoxin
MIKKNLSNKSNLNKIFTIFLLFIILFSPTINASLEKDETDKTEQNKIKTIIYFFWGEGCPHCHKEKSFLDEMISKYPEIEIKSYNAWGDSDHYKLFSEMASAFGTSASGVPATFIDDKVWIGYADYIGKEIEEKIKNCIEKGCADPIEKIKKESKEEKKDEKEISQEKELCIHVFLDYSCRECDETKEFIDSLKFSNAEIKYHNINEEKEKDLYDSFKEMYGLKTAGYPTVFIGENYFIGLDSLKENFEKTIKECKKKDCPCPTTKIKGITPSLPKSDFKPEQTNTINLPIVGDIDIGRMPLFLMTSLIAFIDGFNPCSLWVLTFLLGIVIYTGSRKKILLIGLTFLLVTASAYGLFMLGLINVFYYVVYLLWIKIAVALIATIFAVVNIKDYFWYKKGLSFTISDKYKPKIFKKIRNLMDPNKSTISMIIATILMALGTVLVELPCTAGFPMIWTNIIAQHNISKTLFLSLFLIYILIYLSLELIIFIGVVLTLRKSKFEEKHGRILKLIGGMIMLSLAFALVFMPELMNSITGSIYIFGIAGILSYLIILIHRKILPKYGIKIGTEKIEKEYKKEETNKEKKNKEEKK